MLQKNSSPNCNIGIFGEANYLQEYTKQGLPFISCRNYKFYKYFKWVVDNIGHASTFGIDQLASTLTNYSKVDVISQLFQQALEITSNNGGEIEVDL